MAAEPPQNAENAQKKESASDLLLPVPVAGRVMRIFCGVLDIVPGLGTAVLALNESPVQGRYLFVALLQFLLMFIFLGFLWSWGNGLKMIFYGWKNADGKNTDDVLLPKAKAQNAEVQVDAA